MKADSNLDMTAFVFVWIAAINNDVTFDRVRIFTSNESSELQTHSISAFRCNQQLEKKPCLQNNDAIFVLFQQPLASSRFIWTAHIALNAIQTLVLLAISPIFCNPRRVGMLPNCMARRISSRWYIQLRTLFRPRSKGDQSHLVTFKYAPQFHPVLCKSTALGFVVTQNAHCTWRLSMITFTHAAGSAAGGLYRVV
jgi:hypothetical protein